MLVLTFGQGMTQPNGIAGAISVHPHIAGAASGLLGFIQMVVSAVATLFLAAIQAPTAWPTVGVVSACVALSALAFLWAALPQRRTAADERPKARPRRRAKPPQRIEPEVPAMPEPAAIWSALTPDEHEYQYNPQRAVPNFKDYQAERAPANDRARETLQCHRDVAYAEGRCATSTSTRCRARAGRPCTSSSMAATGARRTRPTSPSSPSIWWHAASPRW